MSWPQGALSKEGVAHGCQHGGGGSVFSVCNGMVLVVRPARGDAAPLWRPLVVLSFLSKWFGQSADSATRPVLFWQCITYLLDMASIVCKRRLCCLWDPMGPCSHASHTGMLVVMFAEKQVAVVGDAIGASQLVALFKFTMVLHCGSQLPFHVAPSCNDSSSSRWRACMALKELLVKLFTINMHGGQFTRMKATSPKKSNDECRNHGQVLEELVRTRTNAVCHPQSCKYQGSRLFSIT